MSKMIHYMAALGLVIGCFMPSGVYAGGLEPLFSSLETLNIQRNGYTLGKKLTPQQLETAAKDPVKTPTPGTFKFRDHGVFVVAQEGSNRVLVIYEQFEAAKQQKVQDIVGELYMTFDEPTVSAHDKVVYWAYTKGGKVSSQKFNTAKDKKKALDILATIKFVSDIKIMEKQSADVSGQAYYIISSDPVLKQISGSDS